MLSPIELAQKIDAYMVENCGDAAVFDANGIAKGLLQTLERDDRVGIDPDMLRLRVMARGCTLPGMRPPPAPRAKASRRRMWSLGL